MRSKKRVGLALVIAVALLLTAIMVPVSALAESTTALNIGYVEVQGGDIEVPSRAPRVSVPVSVYIYNISDNTLGEGTISVTFRELGSSATITGSRRISGQAESSSSVELVVSDISAITAALESNDSVTFELESAIFTGTNGASATFESGRYGTGDSVTFTAPPKGLHVAITGDTFTVAKGQTVTPSGWFVTYTNNGDPVPDVTSAPALQLGNSSNAVTAGSFTDGVAPILSVTGTETMDTTHLTATVGSGESAVTGTSSGCIAVADLYALDRVSGSHTNTKTGLASIAKPDSGTAKSSLTAVWSPDGKQFVMEPEGGTYTWTITQDNNAATDITIDATNSNASVEVTSATPIGSYLVTCSWTDGTVTLSAFWDLSVTNATTQSLHFDYPEFSLDDSGSTELATSASGIDYGTRIALTLTPESGSGSDIVLEATAGGYLNTYFKLSEEARETIRGAMGTAPSIVYEASAMISGDNGSPQSVPVTPGTITFTQTAAAVLGWDEAPTDLQVGDTCNVAVSWSDALALEGVDVSYEWKAEPEDAVKIEPSDGGTTATITGQRTVQRVIIMVTATPNGSWPVDTVVAASTNASILISSADGLPQIVFDPVIVTVSAGDTTTVSASVTGTSSPSEYEWTNWTLRFVAVTGTGSAVTIEGLIPGTAEIICTARLGTTNVTGILMVTVVDSTGSANTVSISGSDTVAENRTVTLTATVADYDDLPSSAYWWTVTGGIANVTLTSSGSTATITGVCVGSSTIQVRVDDSRLLNAITAAKTITVTNAIVDPIPTATPSSVTTATPSAEATATPSTEATATPSTEATATPSTEATATLPVVPSYYPTYWPIDLPTAPPAPSASATGNPSATPSSAPTPGQTSPPSSEPTVAPLLPDSGSIIDFEIVDSPTVGGTALEGISFNLDMRETPSVTEFISSSSVPAGAVLTVTTPDGIPVAPNTPVSTGQIVTVTSSDGTLLVRADVVVKGDVLGTGELSLSQLVRMAQAFRGTHPLTGPYLAAGELSGAQDGRITLTDLVQEAQLLRTAGFYERSRT